MINFWLEIGVLDWLVFEEQFDVVEAFDVGLVEVDFCEVDEVIFGKMYQYEVFYELVYWFRMEVMFNEWFIWLQYVLCYKMMELVFFLLFFIICWQYLLKLGVLVVGSQFVGQFDYIEVVIDYQFINVIFVEIQEFFIDNVMFGLNWLVEEEG